MKKLCNIAQASFSTESVSHSAEENRWRIENSKGHPFGQMYCPYKGSNDTCESSGKWCRVGIWSTPRNTASHARSIKKIVDRCIGKQAEKNNE